MTTEDEDEIAHFYGPSHSPFEVVVDGLSISVIDKTDIEATVLVYRPDFGSVPNEVRNGK